MCDNQGVLSIIKCLVNHLWLELQIGVWNDPQCQGDLESLCERQSAQAKNTESMVERGAAGKTPRDTVWVQKAVKVQEVGIRK